MKIKEDGSIGLSLGQSTVGLQPPSRTVPLNASSETSEGISEVSLAYNKGLDIVLFKKNSKNQLKEKLLARGFSNDAIDAAVSQLEEAGYVNDTRYAQSYAKKLMSDQYKTREQIERQLLLKGIDSDTIDEVLQDFKSDREDNREKIKQFVNNKHNKLITSENMTYDKWVSIKRSLYNKGYNIEDIERVIEEMMKEWSFHNE